MPYVLGSRIAYLSLISREPMKIFVAFSDEDREVVETIVASLKGDGHQVFYDEDSLPPGDSYDAKIEKAVKSSNAMVFCISPSSLEEHAYSLTELKFAKEKWPSARKHVLPVLVRDTEFQEIPAYLNAVTVLRPEGNVAAETSSAVRKIRDKLWFTRVFYSFLAMMLVVCGIVTYLLIQPPKSIIFDQSVTCHAASVFELEEKFRVAAKFVNADSKSHFFSAMEVEFEPRVERFSFAHDLESQEFELVPNSATLLKGDLAIDSDALPNELLWRVTMSTESETFAGKWTKWDPVQENTNSYETIGLSDRIRLVDKVDGDFVAICNAPPELILLDLEGKQIRGKELPGTAAAVSTYKNQIAASILDPPSIKVFDSRDFAEVLSTDLPALKNEHDEHISTKAFSLALTDKSLWVSTSEDAGERALFRYDKETKKWGIPHSFWDVDPHGLVLRPSPTEGVIGFSTLNSPTTLYKIHPDRFVKFHGANIRDIGSASDFRWYEKMLLYRNKENSIALASITNDRFVPNSKYVEVFRDWETEDLESSWNTELIGGTPDFFFVAINKQIGDAIIRTEIVCGHEGEVVSLFHEPESKTEFLTVVDGVALATIKHVSGKTRTILLRADQGEKIK